MSKLVAVEAGAGAAGAIVYWRLSGDVVRGELIDALAERGLRKVDPREITGEVALRRALDVVVQSGHTRILARPLGGGRGRWALVMEVPHEGSLAHRVLAHLAVNARGDDFTVEAREMTHVDFLPFEGRIRAAFQAALYTLAGADISAWLTRQIVPALDAVSLRDTGGMYFVPKAALPLLDVLCEALGAASQHTIYRIPAMHSADAADAVLAAIEDEAKREIAEIETYLAEHTDLGDRARRAKQDTCAAVRAKLTRYEDLFGRRLDAIGARLGRLRNELAGVAVIEAAAADGRETEGRVLELDDRQVDVEPEWERERPLDLD